MCSALLSHISLINWFSCDSQGQMTILQPCQKVKMKSSHCQDLQLNQCVVWILSICLCIKGEIHAGQWSRPGGGGESSTPAGNGWLFAAKGLSLMAEIPLWQLKSRRLFHALCCTSLPPKTPPALTINTQKAKAGVSDLEVDVEKAAGKENVCYLVMFVPFSLFISTGKMRRSMHWNK